MTTILIASDYASSVLKTALVIHLQRQELSLQDLNTEFLPYVEPYDIGDGTADYPIVNYPYLMTIMKTLIDAMTDDTVGILICGGITVGQLRNKANRYKGIRCAVAATAEMAQFTRMHGNKNMLIIGSDLLTQELAIACMDTFLQTPPYTLNVQPI